MNKLPEDIKEKILLDSIILQKGITNKYYDIHKELKNYHNKIPIYTVIKVNGIFYKHLLRNYKTNKNGQIILPKLSTGEQFYSAGYYYRITGVNIGDLPKLYTCY